MSVSMPAVSSGAYPALGSMSLSRLSPRLRAVVLALSISFAAMPFLFITTFQVGGYRLNDLQGTAFFLSLALLPGLIGICFHIITAATRRVKGSEAIHQYYAFRASRERARKQERSMNTLDQA